MSRNLNYKQVANVTRRTWDLETYEQKAKSRTQAMESGGRVLDANAGDKRAMGEDGGQDKEEFVPAASSARKAYGSDRALLKARSRKVDIDSRIGSIEMVSSEAIATTSAKTGSTKDGVVKSGVGWHCSVCDCFLKDSMTYLDHINGRKHQKNLGYSMKVERSSKNDVASKLKRILDAKKSKKQKEQQVLMGMADAKPAKTNYTDAVRQKDEEEKRRKEERSKERKARKQKKKEAKRQARKRGVDPAAEDGNDDEAAAVVKKEESNAEEEEEEQGGIDPAMAAMMGFSSFGG